MEPTNEHFSQALSDDQMSQITGGAGVITWYSIMENDPTLGEGEAARPHHRRRASHRLSPLRLHRLQDLGPGGDLGKPHVDPIRLLQVLRPIQIPGPLSRPFSPRPAADTACAFGGGVLLSYRPDKGQSSL